MEANPDHNCKPTCWQRNHSRCILFYNDLQDKCPCFRCLLRVNCSIKCPERHQYYLLHKPFIYESHTLYYEPKP